MLTLLCPRCGGVLDPFPRCRCGYHLPRRNGVYLFTAQGSRRLSGGGPHYLGYSRWGRCPPLGDSYARCARRLVELAGTEGWYIDLGTGYGQVPLYLARAGARVLAVDISLPVLRTLAGQARAQALSRRVLCTRMDAYRLAVGTGGAAVVLVNNLFPMVDTPELVLAEAARVLQPGGRLAMFGTRPVETPPPGRYEAVEAELFARFEARLDRLGWRPVWFGETGVGAPCAHFRPPVCLPAGPPRLRTHRLEDKLRRLGADGFNRYQHVPHDLYRRAWKETLAYAAQTYGPNYGAISLRRMEEDVVYLYGREVDPP